jgi:hypothetical protein
MPTLKNLVKATAAVSVANAVAGAFNKNGVVDGLKNAAQNLGGQLDKLKQIPNLDPSQILNKIPGQSVNPLAAGIIGGVIKTERAKLLSNLDEENVVEFEANELPLRNILSNYAVVNYFWTMSVLTPFQINFPDETYKKGDIGDIIFQSAGGNPENRVGLKAYASPNLGDIDRNPPDYNPEGKFDFFIDNVRIKSVIGMDAQTKNTNATTMSFNILEPNSFGMFFQSLQMAAANNGYENWVVMPVLLTLQFKGHYSADTQNIDYAVTKRHFPIRITNINLRVTERGSLYECEAVAWNDQAYSDTVSSIPVDITCEGSTVQQMIQDGPMSVQSILNDALVEQAIKNKISIPDRIVFLFPTDTSTGKGDTTDDSSSPKGATANPNVKKNDKLFKQLGLELSSDGYNLVQKANVNPVGKASIGFTDRRKAQGIFGKEGVSYDEKTKVLKRGRIELTSNKGLATFKQGTLIPTILNEVLSSSSYGISALDPANISKEGKIQWYKISSQVYVLDTDENVGKLGRNPYLTVFRIIPFEVQHSQFISPETKPSGVGELKKTSLKEYNYYYSGKNTEILDFQIKFNTTFYTSMSSDAGKNNQDAVQRDKNATVATPTSPVVVNGKVTQFRRKADGTLYDAKDEYNQGKHGNVNINDSATKVLINTDRTKIKKTGGGIFPDDPATLITKQFMESISKGADMITVNMKILGDPFFLGDSGIGNFTEKGTSNKNINKSGAINNERSEVYITINFRNPIDINGNLYDFPNEKIVPQISGLYKVNMLESMFDRGMFSQDLELTRMPNYDSVSPGGTGATSGENAVDFAPPTTTPTVLETPQDSDSARTIQDAE